MALGIPAFQAHVSRNNYLDVPGNLPRQRDRLPGPVVLHDGGVREPGVSPGLTRSGEGDGQRMPFLIRTAATGAGLREGALRPDDPESEDLLALAAIAARSYADPAHGFPDQRGSSPMQAQPVTRTRRDRCPGALRPWQASDGLLVRLRLIGGRVTSASLRALLDVAEQYGDGRIHVTMRANLQVRAFPGRDGALAPQALAAIESTGLLPVPSHELVRNVMVSPQTGLAGGLTDLQPAATSLDSRLCADKRLAGLPGKFLFVLDDGRGDLIDRGCDLGLVALDGEQAQIRVGEGWGAVVPISDAAARLVELAGGFLLRRGTGSTAPWHVAELPGLLVPALPPDPRLPKAAGPLPYGPVPGGRHIAVPDTGLGRAMVAELTTGVPEVIVTPWGGVLVPERNAR